MAFLTLWAIIFAVVLAVIAIAYASRANIRSECLERELTETRLRTLGLVRSVHGLADALGDPHTRCGFESEKIRREIEALNPDLFPALDNPRGKRRIG